MSDAPWVLRDYALLADGERGALIGPRGEVVWMCAPRWHSDAVFSELIGGPGDFTLCPDDPWHVWGGYYEDGSLIRVSRWTLTGGVSECREALAMPSDARRAVMLRQVRAVHGDAVVRIRLSVCAGFGAHPMKDPRRRGAQWHARSGPLYVRLLGVPEAVPDDSGVLTARITVPEGSTRDLVLEIADGPEERPLEPGRLWAETERHWAESVPDCAGLAGPRDARLAYAILAGLTSHSGGMVAAATTSLPERAEANRDYDYRYAWIRDQCYAGLAVAAHGVAPRLLDDAVRFVSERILDHGPGLYPAYTVDGRAVPDERSLPLRGYPGGCDRIGNRAGRQFQLDTFGEALQLFAAAGRLGRLPGEAVRAMHIAAEAIEDHWQRPDAGMWELQPAWWTHSRLAAVAGLRIAAREAAAHRARRWTELADAILRETERTCRHPSGRWQRAPRDPRVDSALLRPLSLPVWPPQDPGLTLTRQAVERDLTSDGYVYRFRYDNDPLDRHEGAFLLCGFLMSAACLAEGRRTEGARWFERTRSACGSPGLFAEEYDVTQRQLRGNLPQAFVHALLLENAVLLGSAPRKGPVT